MGVTVVKGNFTDKDEAIKEVLSQSLFPREGAMGAGDLEDVHWHKTGLKIFVLEGTFETLDAASGTTLIAEHGDVITIPPVTLHAAQCPVPATYVVGFESQEAASAFCPERLEDFPQEHA